MRFATAEDMANVLDMGETFHRESGQLGRFDPATFATTIHGLMHQPNAALIVSERGMIGGVLVPSFCDANWIQAIELFWWAQDGQGIALLRAFEDWAESVGADEVRITTQDANKRPNALLRRKGYEPMETSFKRVV